MNLQEGKVILPGAHFIEPMRIITVQQNGTGRWDVGLVGIESERFRKVTLTEAEIRNLQILDSIYSYDGDSQLLRLGIQAYSLGIAYEFDPYFALSMSKVDPLPHQLEAVYDYMLKLARIKFLLADDAGAGKTIMAGLLIRELKLRGLAEQILIVCPANLTFQWERELKDKFDEKFKRIKGSDLDSYSMNQWLESKQVITSLDLAKLDYVLPGLKQVHWHLVVVDEAHRMSASAADKKSLRYELGELLRESSDHILLLTATPHKGDPVNFSLFLQLLDKDAYADVRSIREAMDKRRAPFYLRRTKEAMVYFPERQGDGTWTAKKIFTKRIPRTIDFKIDGDEFDLYRDVTRFIKMQSARAAAQGDDPRARAVGFLMSLYQRRLASSTYALRRSLENRIQRLTDKLKRAEELVKTAPPRLPDEEELEEMEDEQRERLEDLLEAITLAQAPAQVNDEIEELRELSKQAEKFEQSEKEEKLSRLKRLLQDEGFFKDPNKRLIIFTEFKDTLQYLVEKLKAWGFRVGYIHGSMKSGSRDMPGTRLYSEQQFWDGETQILVATEAAGEGINLHCCHVMFNYDIPWNPNRLEQRMGRIHRYGQKEDCLIFNFVATNTVEGHVLQKLLEKLQEIRDALEDDAVFNVVGEILPAAHMEKVLRDYYAGKFGDADLEERILRDVKEEKFRSICQHALEGLASKKLNLGMLIERRALAQERRVVPETIARFIQGSADYADLSLKPVKAFPHTFDSKATPLVLKHYDREPDWKLSPLANKYSRFSTDREIAEKNSFEWITPGHPLFEALRRHTLDKSQEPFGKGACFYSLGHDEPVRIDIYRARVGDGLGNIIHERLFAVEISEGKEPRLVEPRVLENLQEAKPPVELPSVAKHDEARAWIHDNALTKFLEEVRAERVKEIENIANHVELSLTELISKEDALIGRFTEEAERRVEGAAGLLKQAEDRHAELLARRERRRDELKRQKTLLLQGVERITSVLVLPHPERDDPEVRRMRPDPEVEAIAMQEAMKFEKNAGRDVDDVHEKNLGYDLRSLDPKSGQLRLIEVKGFSASEGLITLTPNEHKVAEDRRDCYWLYLVTNCKTDPKLEEFKDPAVHPWKPIQKIQHYTLNSSQLAGAKK